MATAEQVKTLIRSHFGSEPERFYTVALQVAAYEAGQGHGELAREIRDIVDKAKRIEKTAKVLPFPCDLEGLVETYTPTESLSSLVLPEPLRLRIERILHEYANQEKLKHFGLRNRRKILLSGPAGTGKTLTSKVLAHELRLPLRIVQVDRLVTKFMGETSAKLRQIFDLVHREKSVYFFDEFDAIGGGRALDNDVGEMRRVLNSLLQFIEQDQSESMIVAATNSPELLDRALFRRFDDILFYQLPDEAARRNLIANVLGTFVSRSFSWKTAVSASEGLSSAEVDIACRDALKDAVLMDKKSVSAKSVVQNFDHRRSAHTHN